MMRFVAAGSDSYDFSTFGHQFFVALTFIPNLADETMAQLLSVAQK
jgi:hypothetical protein